MYKRVKSFGVKITEGLLSDDHFSYPWRGDARWGPVAGFVLQQAWQGLKKTVLGQGHWTVLNGDAFILLF